MPPLIFPLPDSASEQTGGPSPPLAGPFNFFFVKSLSFLTPSPPYYLPSKPRHRTVPRDPGLPWSPSFFIPFVQARKFGPPLDYRVSSIDLACYLPAFPLFSHEHLSFFCFSTPLPYLDPFLLNSGLLPMHYPAFTAAFLNYFDFRRFAYHF